MKKTFLLMIFPVLLLLLSTIYVEGLKSEKRRELKTAVSAYEKIRKEFSRMERIKSVRADFFSRIFLMDFPKKFVNTSVPFLRGIEKKSAGSLFLSRLTLISDVGKIDFELKLKFPRERSVYGLYRWIENNPDVIYVSKSTAGKFFLLKGELETE